MAFNSLVYADMASVTAPSAPGTPTGTLAAATPVALTFDTATASRLSLVIKNTGGSNAIGTVKVEKSPTGVLYGEDVNLGTAIGSLAAGASVLVELAYCSFDFLRVTLTSADGSTYSVDIKGVR